MRKQTMGIIIVTNAITACATKIELRINMPSRIYFS